MKVMITGATGKLGSELVKLYKRPLTPTHAEMPVEDRKAVEKYIKKHKPGILIHTAAMTKVMSCEILKGLAWEINTEGTKNLLAACEKYVPDCYFVFISTPCEFDGSTPRPKMEYHDDKPSSHYGYTKMMARDEVCKSNLKWLIIRANFISRGPYPYPKAFTDRFGNWLFADQVAKGIKEVVDEGLTGIVHIAGNRMMTMLELARMCPNGGEVKPTTLKEYKKEFPEGPELTKYQILYSERWKYYDIDGSKV